MSKTAGELPTRLSKWSCISLNPTPLVYLERIDARYKKPSDDECWVWTGCLSAAGYGRAHTGYDASGKQNTVITHQAMYELYVGQIPPGLTIDHLCGNKACGNPSHMKILTKFEDYKIKASARKTHCPHGHEYTTKNIIYNKRNNGGLYRRCRTCSNKRVLQHYYKTKTLSTTS